MPPARHSELYRTTNNSQPERIDMSRDTYTAAKAAMKYQARMLWRDGYQYAERTQDSITMQRGDNIIKLHIQSDPARRKTA